MVTLLLDSANSHLSIGFLENNHLVYQFHELAWQKQSEMMVDVINKAMENHGWSRDTINSIIVGIGPGSYTGIRIALTVAKVMAVALKIPLIPVSSLQILAHENRPSICLINARSQRSYFAVYEGEKPLVSDTILTNLEALAYIKSHPDYELCGQLEYLGIKGNNFNPLKKMATLREHLSISENPLKVNPIYLKDL